MSVVFKRNESVKFIYGTLCFSFFKKEQTTQTKFALFTVKILLLTEQLKVVLTIQIWGNQPKDRPLDG